MFIQGLLLPLVMTKQINHFNELNVLATLAGLIISSMPTPKSLHSQIFTLLITTKAYVIMME